MTDFYKRFLAEDSRRAIPESGRFVALAAFGKHPGWGDHIEGENLGLETESLTLAKTAIYNEGIRFHIESGTWEKLEDDHRLAQLNHAFVWQRGGQFLVGRICPSKDSVGRDRYPMIFCAHCVGVPLAWALEQVLPRLENLERVCQTTSSAEEVRTLLDRARAELRAAVSGAASGNERAFADPVLRSQFVSNALFGPANEGWFRILYWLQAQAGAFINDKFGTKGDLTGLRAQQIRVPLATPSPVQSVLLWGQFFFSQVDRRVPALFVWPAGESWLDVTLGEPSTREFACLRKTRAEMPLATEVPYTFDQKFREQAAQKLKEFEGALPAATATSTPPKNGSGDGQSGFASVTQRWFKKLGGKALLLLALMASAAIIGGFAIHRWPYGLSPSGTNFAPVQTLSQNKRAPPEAASAIESEQTPKNTLADEAAKKQQTNRQAAEATEKERLTAAEAGPREQDKHQTEQAARAEASTTMVAEPGAKNAVEAKPAGPQQNPGLAPTAQGTNLSSVTNSSTTPAVPPVLASVQPAATKAGLVEPTAVKQDLTTRQSFTNSIGMAMVWVPGLAGKSPGAWVGKFEVTQQEFEQVMGFNPSKSKASQQPVENVTWQETVEFCRKLTEAEKAAAASPPGFVYSLPTRAQWDFFLGDARFEDAVTSRRQAIRTNPAPVGSLPPNQLGLHDVLGNVWEWCLDSDSPAERVLKGSAFNNNSTFQFRALVSTTPWTRSNGEKSAEAGFRCVLVPPP